VGLGSSRADFWIPSQRTAIEVKFARTPNDGRKLDNELKRDFIDYRAVAARAR
jgi:hypothetical protein